VSVILCESVCLNLCVTVPGVLVKYSEIDLTPKAFRRSQMGIKEDLFLVLLLLPLSHLPNSSHTLPNHSNLYLSVCIYHLYIVP